MPFPQQSIVEALHAAKAMIDTPEKWAQGLPATRRNERGMCALEALDKAAPWPGYDQPDPFGDATRWLAKAVRGDVAGFNDSHPHADVMDAFDRAIALAEESS